jgi:serine/threonine protein kinase
MPDEVDKGGGGADDEQRHVETVIKSDAHGGPESFAQLRNDDRSAPMLAALQVSTSGQSVKDPVIGTTVNGYVVRGKLGAGGMGIVYSGDHPVIGKRAAIKVLRPEIAENEEQVKRLVSEARAVNAVGHRGIIDVFGYDTLPDGRQCIVMEYLDGEPLADMLARNRKEKRVMPIPQVLVVLEEMLSALGAAHSAGVVHRDLKPSNIFLCRQRDGLSYVKLLDFGIAKLGVMGGSSPQTNASMLVGTPSYMAPEQARGGAVTPAMDLYAVGIIAFEMLTGELPFTGESVVEVLMKHAEEPPQKPSSLLMSIPDDLDDVVMRLLQKAPGDRFQTADEVRDLVTRCRKTLSESTARSIGLAIGRGIPKSGAYEAHAPATPPSQPVSSATPFGTPTPQEVRPPPPPADMTRIKSGGTAEVQRPTDLSKPKLPAEMVAATQAIPEGARYKGPAPAKSRGMMLGVIGLLLGLVALGVAFFAKQPPAAQPQPQPAKVEKAPEPKPEPMKVEAPKQEPAPEPVKAEEPVKVEPKREPVKAEAPKAEPKAEPAPKKQPEPVKSPVVVAAKPEPKAAPPAKGDKLLNRFLALDKAAAGKPDAVPAVERTMLGKYIEKLKDGTIKPEQREQAEGFANHVDSELKGQ